MMYSEFVAGTGCKQTEKNYEIFKELEIIYMNSNCTKEHIYEMGRKLVDNSKSEEQIEFEKRVTRRIEAKKDEIAMQKSDIERYESYMGLTSDKQQQDEYKQWIKGAKQYMKILRSELRELKWVLEEWVLEG